MSAISKFNELINNKIRQDAKNGILNEESLYIAKHIMEKIKTKSDINVKLILIQLSAIIENHEDLTLDEIISNYSVYVYND